MKLNALKLTAFAMLLVSSVYNSRAYTAPEAFGSSTKRTVVKIDEKAVDPKMQELVNQFQAWALAKTKNSSIANDMIIIPTVSESSNKTINGTGQKLTQEKMTESIVMATTAVGYKTPMDAILGFKFNYQKTGSDFLKMSDSYILKELSHNNPTKAQSLIEARNMLNQNFNGVLPVEAKVIGPTEPVNICADLSKSAYGKTVPCNQARLKVPVRIFGTAIQKILESGVLDEEDLKALLEIATTNYYFVRNQEGRWVLEEVPFSGVGRVLVNIQL